MNKLAVGRCARPQQAHKDQWLIAFHKLTDTDIQTSALSDDISLGSNNEHNFSSSVENSWKSW